MKKGLLTLLVCCSLLLVACQQAPALPPDDPVLPPPEDKPSVCPFTGQLDVPLGQPVLIVVDNHPNARPQQGLEWADVIYEVPVEGGLTRFIALWSRPIPTAIGPIRSARPYFVHLANEHQLPLLHHGQSAGFRSVVTELGASSLSLEPGVDHPIWRDAGRIAPHNLYTSLLELQSFVSQASSGYTTYKGKQMLFKNGRDIGSVSRIGLQQPLGYNVEYRMDGEGRYTRFTEGQEHGFAVDNIIVQMTTVHYGDECGVDLIGGGVAYFFTRGHAYSGTWHKANVVDRTIFRDGSGKEWEMTPGNTIIHVVPLLTSVTYR